MKRLGFILLVALLPTLYGEEILIETTIRIGDCPKGGLATTTNSSKCYVPDLAAPISVIDTRTNTLVKRIDISPSIGSIRPVVSKDGGLLFAPASPRDLLIICTKKDKILGRVMLPGLPLRVALPRKKDRVLVYTTSSAGSMISLVDVSKAKVIKSVEVPRTTFFTNLVITPDQKYILATCSMDNSVAVIEFPTLSLIRSIPVGVMPVDITLDWKGRKAYVSNYKSKALSIIEIGSFGVKELGLAGGPFLARMQTNKDYLWVMCNSGDVIYVIDTRDDRIISSIPIGGISSFASSIVFHPKKKIAVVSAPSAGKLYLIDATDHTGSFGSIIRCKSLGGRITALEFLKNGRYLYIVNESGRCVIVASISKDRSKVQKFSSSERVRR
jgi:YVTN family beta-propeller protein